MTYEAPNRNIQLIDLGLIDYKEAWDYQEKLFAEIIAIIEIIWSKAQFLII